MGVCVCGRLPSLLRKISNFPRPESEFACRSLRLTPLLYIRIRQRSKLHRSRLRICSRWGKPDLTEPSSPEIKSRCDIAVLQVPAETPRQMPENPEG